jgi:acetolactate synthase-1/2/3 large subunit
MEGGRVSEAVIEPVRLPGDEDAVRRAASLIESAKKPLLFSGGGVAASGASADVVRFMERFGIPGATTMAGTGTIPVDHALCLGGPSYTAGETFHAAIREADVVIAFGAAFSGLEGFGLPPLWSDRIRFIHVDIDPMQIGLNVYPEVSILGDAKTVLSRLSDVLAGRGFGGRKKWESWRRFLSALKAGRQKRLARHADRSWPVLHPGRLVREMAGRLVEDDALMVIDGGNTALFTAMYSPPVGPGRTFFPYGMSALGGGVPYAVGVSLASPGKRVVLVTGDGAFMYNVQELETMVRLSLPIVVIVNNDSAWNMIRSMQDSFFARNFVGTDLPCLDYAGIARGFGLHSQRVTRPEDMLPAYESAVRSKGPALIDCVTDCRNVPDSLLSFALVEFEGSLVHLDPVKVAKSLWMSRDAGLARNMHVAAYVLKALLGINPSARLSSKRKR